MSEGYHDDLRVEKRHGEVTIYDKLGGSYIAFTEDEAEQVKDRLEEVLADD